MNNIRIILGLLILVFLGCRIPKELKVKLESNRLGLESIRARFGATLIDTIEIPKIEHRKYLEELLEIRDSYEYINNISRLKHSDYLATYQSECFGESEFKSVIFTKDGRIQRNGSTSNYLCRTDKLCTPNDYYYSLLFDEENYFSIIILHIESNGLHSAGTILTLNTYSQNGVFISQEVIAGEIRKSLVLESSYKNKYSVLEGNELTIHSLEKIRQAGIETSNSKAELLIFDKNGFLLENEKL